MSMWTVYDHPRDYPNSFVARQWIVEDGRERPTANIIIAPDLGMLRELLLTQIHLQPIPRSPSDDPKIVETWL